MDELTLAAELTKVKGIGRWSVDMFSMFHLGHPDVLPVGDLGVRRGMGHLYGLRELPGPAQMADIAAIWAPWRSVGSYYMWRVDVPRAARRPRAAR
jgi:DNA-3-methyladenine glycosylase II